MKACYSHYVQNSVSLQFKRRYFEHFNTIYDIYCIKILHDTKKFLWGGGADGELVGRAGCEETENIDTCRSCDEEVCTIVGVIRISTG